MAARKNISSILQLAVKKGKKKKEGEREGINDFQRKTANSKGKNQKNFFSPSKSTHGDPCVSPASHRSTLFLVSFLLLHVFSCNFDDCNTSLCLPKFSFLKGKKNRRKPLPGQLHFYKEREWRQAIQVDVPIKPDGGGGRGNMEDRPDRLSAKHPPFHWRKIVSSFFFFGP